MEGIILIVLGIATGAIAFQVVVTLRAVFLILRRMMRSTVNHPLQGGEWMSLVQVFLLLLQVLCPHHRFHRWLLRVMLHYYRFPWDAGKGRVMDLFR